MDKIDHREKIWDEGTEKRIKEMWEKCIKIKGKYEKPKEKRSKGRK